MTVPTDAADAAPGAADPDTTAEAAEDTAAAPASPAPPAPASPAPPEGSAPQGVAKEPPYPPCGWPGNGPPQPPPPAKVRPFIMPPPPPPPVPGWHKTPQLKQPCPFPPLPPFPSPCPFPGAFPYVVYMMPPPGPGPKSAPPAPPPPPPPPPPEQTEESNSDNPDIGRVLGLFDRSGQPYSQGQVVQARLDPRQAGKPNLCRCKTLELTSCSLMSYSL